MESEPFKDFVERSVRIVDRALYLSESLDIMQDYKHDEADDKQYVFLLITLRLFTAPLQSNQTTTREATLKATLFDERWSKHRSVTDLGWSHKHPGIFMVFLLLSPSYLLSYPCRIGFSLV
jgi:dynein intermediate chain, cytosolic